MSPEFIPDCFLLWQGNIEFNAMSHNCLNLLFQSTQNLSLHHAPTARGWGRDGIGNSRMFFIYLFNASFSDMKLKPGTVSGHLFLIFTKAVFLCKQLLNWYSFRGMIGGDFHSAILLCLQESPVGFISGMQGWFSLWISPNGSHHTNCLKHKICMIIRRDTEKD